MTSAKLSQNSDLDGDSEKQIEQVEEQGTQKLPQKPTQEFSKYQEPPSELKQGKMEPIKDPSKALDQTLTLLKAKDDTSRFVGLALVKSILDNKVDFQKDAVIVERCWTAIPAKFIDRLLKAGANENKNKEESLSMVELAVAVLHAFIILLPVDLLNTEKFVDRVGGLVDALAWSPPDTRTQILQILITLASTQMGSNALLRAKNWPQLVALSPQQDLALDVVKYVFVASFTNDIEDSGAQDIFNATLDSLISLFRNHLKVARFFRALHEILTTTLFAVLSSPPWLRPLANIIIQSCLSSHKGNPTKDRQAIVLLAATLLHLYPYQFPSLLFIGQKTSEKSPESKPSSYLFTKLLLVDIKASIPSLQEMLNSDEYPATSARIASSYDIISAFIGFLIGTLEEEDFLPLSSRNKNQAASLVPFPPSLLLQIRVDISETLSLTIEHLRDRFDSSIAGAAGLHPSARYRTEDAPNAPLSIAWDSSSTTLAQDPLTLSQLRTLAIWLREDDNDALRKEAAGIMDLLLNLYETEDEKLDFKSPVIIALEGITTVPEGVDAFLAAEGWPILENDIQRIITNPSNDTVLLGENIIRVLVAIVESDVTGPAKEEWMRIITLASHRASSFILDPDHIESLLGLRIAVAQLAVELLARAPKGVKRRQLRHAEELLDFMRGLSKLEVGGELGFLGGVLRTEFGRDTKEELEEVVLNLEGLGVGA